MPEIGLLPFARVAMDVGTAVQRTLAGLEPREAGLKPSTYTGRNTVFCYGYA